ncbi:MAG: chemotaxis protein CheA [Candidatus Kapabacteria bacterium]|nr:chemotaxis protein CheA [Candidatus Kapabacteria bacterium]
MSNGIDDSNLAMILEFVSESFESLDTSEPLIDTLKTEDFKDNVNTIFRTFHTIKGLAGFFEMVYLNKVTHEAETLLDYIRKNDKSLDESTIDIIYKSFDFIRYILQVISVDYIDTAIAEEIPEIIQIIQIHTDHLKNNTVLASNLNKEEISLDDNSFDFNSLVNDEMREQFLVSSFDLIEVGANNLILLEKDNTNENLIAETFGLIHSLKGNSGFMGYSEIEEIAMDTETILDSLRQKELDVDSNIISILLSNFEAIKNRLEIIIKGNADKDLIPLINLDIVEKVIKKEIELPKNEIILDKKNTPIQNKKYSNENEIEKSKQGVKLKNDIRVETNKIDKLFDLVGELITIESMLTNSSDLKNLELPIFWKSANMLNKITRELQDISMSIRMMPIEGLFNKMKRLVRDVSIKMNKKVELVIVGSETEMDKNVIDEIADPLVHILRNAMDHGIELPEVRLNKGKLAEGVIKLEAKYEGNEILIVISDNGAGINRERVLEKAFESGLITNPLEKLTDKEVYMFIFEAGFSTAKEVTDISGRGVGMDVVKKNIEKLHGTIDLDSEFGKGSTFTLRIPLTLAIMEAMLIRVGKSTYALPILALRESFKCNINNVTITMDGLEMVRIRNEVLPIIRLHELFNIMPTANDLKDGILMVVETRNKRVCLFVDEILGQQQAVVKAISDYVGKINGITGCMILGDGNIGLIIDIEGLFRMSESNFVLNLN